MRTSLNERRIAAVAAVGFLGLSVFQLALALGVPWGRAAWGGVHRELPLELRIGSAVALFVWLGSATLILRRVGYWGPAHPSRLLRKSTWLLAGVLSLGSIMNFASSSPWERFGWGPYALGLAVLTFTIARSHETHD